jgi:ABC-type branched-subunit amino acid transport system substrate-binding protein
MSSRQQICGYLPGLCVRKSSVHASAINACIQTPHRKHLMNLPHVTANLRNILVGVATALLASTSALAEPGVTNDAITLGQSTALSGPLGDLGQEVLKGSKAYFDALNARGGINGRKICSDRQG